jgi:hypothetical protein
MDHVFLLRQFQENGERIRALVAGVDNEHARIKPDDESWSILEVVNHLYEEEMLDFRTRLRIILQAPEEDWPPIDPSGWVSEHKYNERDLQESLENFLRERKASLTWLESLGTPDWETEYSRDGRSMRAGDMFAAWMAHDQLHLRQLVELHRMLAERAVRPYDLGYAGDW